MAVSLVMLLLCVGAAILVLLQAQRIPSGRPEYVALGSSFAAGADLGPLQSDSPWLCARSIHGYPQLLATMRRLEIVDMSCGGAKAGHLLHGGQFFQRPQIRPIVRETKLVTITIGGNDTLYIGDLSQLAARNSQSFWGRLVAKFWRGPKTPSEREYPEFETELVALIGAIHARAPDAKIIVVTYPTILPPAGTCRRLGLTEAEADGMRQVGNQLAAITRSAARKGGAMLVDMHAIGVNHHACSANPWTRGWENGGIAPFHPTQAGARATANAISRSLDGHQQL